MVPLGVRPPLRPASLSLAAMAARCILVISVVVRISVGPDCRGSFVQVSPMEEVLSLAELEEREVPLIAELDRDGLVPSDETLVFCDYYSDLTSLDGEKAERLYEELTRRKGEKDGNDEA